jgi:hypothetical protein
MTPEIAEAIHRLPNGGVYWRHVRARLTRLAHRDPFEFWVAYWDAINAPDADTRADLKELLETNPDPTFKDAKDFFDGRNAVAK